MVSMRQFGLLPLVLCATALAQTESRPVLPKLGKPVKIEAAGKPIDVDGGHAAPLVVDWNRDGKKDLLVGEFGSGGGKLRIYPNVGEANSPTFEKFTYLDAGGEPATVPSS